MYRLSEINHGELQNAYRLQAQCQEQSLSLSPMRQDFLAMIISREPCLEGVCLEGVCLEGVCLDQLHLKHSQDKDLKVISREAE